MARKALVGMLLLGGLIIFGIATFYVENWQASLQLWFGEGSRLIARFPMVGTLDKGDIVRMAGVEVGSVQDLTIDSDPSAKQPVTAVLWIRSGVSIRADDMAKIRIKSVFGENYISIERGDPTAHVLQDGDEIDNTDVAPTITEVAEEAKYALTEIKLAAADVAGFMDQLREGEGILPKLLEDKEMAEDLMASLENINKITTSITEGEGILPKLLDDKEMADDLRASLENINKITTAVTEGEGILPKLLEDKEMADDLTASLENISKITTSITEGEGLLPKLLEDKELADEVSALVTEAREAVTNLKDATAALDKNLTPALENLKDITASIAEGKGTMGRLIKDDKAYTQLMDLLDSLQGIVDTYREQSPVLSFAGAVFGAF